MDVGAGSYRRSYEEEVSIVLSALDCVLNGELGVYASSPLTTGRRLYALLEMHGVPDSATLKAQVGSDALRRLVWDPNVEAAAAFRRRLYADLGNHAPVITPAPLDVPRWSQQNYHDFWGELIRTRTAKAYFSHEWQYSSGCVYEFTVASATGIPTFDHELGKIDLNTGRELIQVAISELELRGFAAQELENGLAELTALERTTQA